MKGRRSIALAAAAYLVVEICLGLLVRSVRSRFPWLVVPGDATPEIPDHLVRDHIERSFDADLGWCRRPGQQGADPTTDGVAEYRIDEWGRRHNPGFEQAPEEIACFGDSYAFCRMVGDDQTWPHRCSCALGVNVANYGVGNYGLDQALMRLERELPTLRARIVVMGVVPETIVRVHSRWKHYFEYGNVLAFKPRFTLDSGGLTLHPSPMRTAADYARYREQWDDVTRLDGFYRRKFRRDLVYPPYLVRLLRRPGRHLPIILNVLRSNGRAFDVVLRDNARWTARMYREPGARDLLSALVGKFAETCRSAGKEPVLLFVPQLVDLERDCGRAHGGFASGVRTLLPVVDVTERFRSHPDVRSLFVHGKLGPHCSAAGNDVVAEALLPVLSGLLGCPAQNGPTAGPAGE